MWNQKFESWKLSNGAVQHPWKMGWLYPTPLYRCNENFSKLFHRKPLVPWLQERHDLCFKHFCLKITSGPSKLEEVVDPDINFDSFGWNLGSGPQFMVVHYQGPLPSPILTVQALIQLEKITNRWHFCQHQNRNFTFFSLTWPKVNKNKQNSRIFCEKDKTDIEFQMVLVLFTAK